MMMSHDAPKQAQSVGRSNSSLRCGHCTGMDLCHALSRYLIELKLCFPNDIQCSKLRVYFMRPSGADRLKMCARDFTSEKRAPGRGNVRTGRRVHR